MKRIFTSFLILLTITGKAQISYHDVDPDTTVNTWNEFSVLGAEIWWHPTPEVVITTWGTTEILCAPASNLPLALEAGDPINSSGHWTTTSYECLNCNGSTGNWKGVTDKYLGIRSKNAAGEWLYGWARLDINNTPTYFIIKDYAARTTGNTQILAGQMNTTSITHTTLNTGNITPVVSGKTVSFRGLQKEIALHICDMNGRTIQQSTIAANGRVNMSSFPAGMYIFHVEGEVFKIMIP